MKKNTEKHSPVNPINETLLFDTIAKILENRKFQAAVIANQKISLMFWEIDSYINSAILEFKRAVLWKEDFLGVVEKIGRKIRKIIPGKEFIPDNPVCQSIRRYGNSPKNSYGLKLALYLRTHQGKKLKNFGHNIKTK